MKGTRILSHWVPERRGAAERGLPRLGAGEQHRGQHRQHEERERGPGRAGRPQAAVEDAGGGETDRGRQARGHRQPDHADVHVEEEGHAAPQDDLERQQLDLNRGRLAEEDTGRVDAREPEPVARAFAGLDGDAALDSQHGREQQGDPEDPGAAWRSVAWSGPMANARSTRTRKAKGTTCQSATRERASIRRSLPATSTASCHMDGSPGAGRFVSAPRRGDATPTGLLACDPAAPHGQRRDRRGDRELRFVRGQQHVAPSEDRLGDHFTRAASASCRRARRAARRAARGRAGGQQRRKAGAAAWPAERRPAGVVRRRRSGRRARGPVGGAGTGARGPDAELGVLCRLSSEERGGMAQKADIAAHGGVVRGEVEPEDGRFAEVTGKPRQGGREAGLAAVGADDDDDLTLVERNRTRRAGKRPASAPATRKWTTGAMAFATMGGGWVPGFQAWSEGNAPLRCRGPGIRRGSRTEKRMWARRGDRVERGRRERRPVFGPAEVTQSLCLQKTSSVRRLPVCRVQLSVAT